MSLVGCGFPFSNGYWCTRCWCYRPRSRAAFHAHERRMEKKQEEKLVSSANQGEVITAILPNDILLGRGALAIANEGNVRFRSLIKERKKEYMSTSRRKAKDVIANEVRAEIERRKGRFVRRIELSDQACATLGLAKGSEGKVYQQLVQ